MSGASLTLVLNGTVWNSQEGESSPELPALQTLLSKGKRSAMHQDANAFLCEQLGITPDIAMAAVSALGDGLDPSDGWWLQADPVHMVADRDQLFLSASSSIGLNQKEAEQLLAELNKVYSDDGWEFYAPSPQRWYLKLPESLSLQTVPTTEAMGHRVGEVLPQGTDAMMWQRVMTEVQMLLHSSSVNIQRSAEGKLVANALWFWGGGALSQVSGQSEHTYFVADEPVLAGLAKLHGQRAKSYSNAELEELVSANAKGLWQLNIDSLEAAESELFNPLLNSVREGALPELTVAISGRGLWHINRAALRRWWRRRKPLSSLLGGEV